MSLINDALKQAKRAEPRNLAPAAGPALSPVENARPSGGPDFLMVSLVTVILLLAGLLLWQWLRGDAAVLTVRAHTAPSALTTLPAVPAPPTAAVPPAIPVPVTTPVPEATITKTTLPATNAPSPANLETAAPPAKPAPPAYKLQSIFYFAKNPSAVINGKTVTIGGKIGEARVLAITKESATLQTPSGETKLLELP